MAKLTLVLEDGQAVVVPVVGRVSLGREEGNDIVVDDQRISARHAELVRGADGSFEVRDLDSKAGTFVNGERIERRRPVAHGDKIAFGPLIAVLDLEDAAAVANGEGAREGAATEEKTSTRKTGRSPRQKECGKAARAELRTGVAASGSKRRKGGPVSAPRVAEVAPVSVPDGSAMASEALSQSFDAGFAGTVEKLEKDKIRLQGEVDALQKALRDWQDRAAKAQQAAHGEQGRLDEVRKALVLAQAEIDSATARERQLQAQLRDAANELSAKGARLEELRTEEERLCQVSASLRDAESTRAQRIEAIDKLSAQLDEKNAEIARLAAAADNAARKLEMVAAQELEVLAHLKQLREERELGESRVGGLRQQVAAMEARDRELAALAQSRSEQASTAEKRLEQVDRERARIEEWIKQTSGAEERFRTARATCLEMESKSRTLSATIVELSAEKHRAEEDLREVKERIAALHEEHSRLSGTIDEALAVQAHAVELRAKEAALQEGLKDLAAAEREQRGRFEEIRRLTSEAEKEFTALKEELARGIEVSRRELADIEIRLAPLRDWKEAMDQRYARLAALPEDSAEARELWREIETEKGKLKNLITVQPGQTRGVSLNELVLKGISANVEKKSPGSKGILHAPAALTEEAGTPGQRANVGATGTGAMYSGTGQEMALKARVSRLRESVQREAMRLEFLRQERAREENRSKSGPGSEAMMREQDRQLESKVRREEERLATLQRKLELGEVEEEKRREKIAELERKIVELRSDIADAERQRSDLRHQADLVQTELRNYEAALERVKRMTE